MRRIDRAMWRSARTASALGELTARWLERTVLEHPGYEGTEGPDPETSGIAASLAALNRAGYVTVASQPGLDDRDDDVRWEQRAAVEGFADDAALAALTAVAAAEGLHLIVHKVDLGWWPRRASREDELVVTRVDGQKYTWFGRSMTRRFLRSVCSPFAGCSAAAIDDVCRLWLVTVVDPVYGRNTMWSHLEEAVEVGRHA